MTGEVTIKLEVELPDGSPVEELAVMIDGQPLHVGDPLSELSFDTRTLADGAHELVVRAVNAKGRVGEASVSFR